MPTFKYDGVEIPFEPGESIIKAAYRQGLEIPHYCWHPGLSAPANCRMCLVEIMPKPGTRPISLDILHWDAKAGEYRPQQKPKLQPACQMPAAEGMDVRGDTSAEVRQARKGVQEFLLLNHPVDCPICDQSGECKLQDYWLEHGQYQKRMRDEPVHKPKAVRFGETIVYDAERCVMCTRCVRFMAEVAKDPVLTMRERGNLNEIAVAPGRVLEGKYTFMTEHVCPVGALTTKDFRFKARVWFLKTAKSVCQGCATGCNGFLDYDPRNNQAYRYRPRDNDQVNKYWMCDDGMLSYKRAHEGRIFDSVVKAAGKNPFSGGSAVGPAAALAEAAKLLKGAPKSTLAVVYSAQHSLEDNWALREVATLLGAASAYVTGMAPGYADDILISPDKNPNTRGVHELVPSAKSFETLAADIDTGSVTHVLALGGETPVNADLSKAVVVTLAANDGPLVASARVVLAATSWAEHSGTYVNDKGHHQVAERALEAQGVSKPAFLLLANLAEALGFSPTWSKLKHVRAKLSGVRPPSDTSPPGASPPPPPAE